MKREGTYPDGDFDLLRIGFKETCAEVARLEAHPDQEPVSAEIRMQRFAAGLPQDGDGLLEARKRAEARLAELERRGR